MSTRTAYPATESAGQTLTAANFDKLPGGWIGYVAITSDVTGLTGAADVTGLSVTVTANTSRRLKVSAYCNLSSGNVNDYGQVRIHEDGTQIGRASSCTMQFATLDSAIICIAITTPSAGSHTYNVKAGRSGSSSGTFTVQASSIQPSWLLVEDMGPA